MSTSSSCQQCKAVGLPILPVRYAVAPTSAKPALPGWAGGNRVKDVALGGDTHYVLRTMREGFIYLFYEKHARGAKLWECYAVGQDGSLTLQPDPYAPRPQDTPVRQCSAHGTNNTQVHYLVIEQPDKCGPTWIAYSEYAWSKGTLDQYTQETRRRNDRMQTIHPGPMAGGAKHAHGAIAEVGALEGVLEYAPGFDDSSLSDGKGNVPAFSQPDGSHDSGLLAQRSTRYPWHSRRDKAEEAVEHMTTRGRSAKPHVLALWDAIGIAHELNGFRNDAAGWISQYGQERELELTAYNGIEGAKTALENRADATLDRAQAQLESVPDLYEARETLARTVLHRDPTDEWALSELAAVERLRAETRAAQAQTRVDRRAQAWPKYEARLDRPAIDAFKTHWDAMLAEAAGVVDTRTPPLLHWLKAPLLLDTLDDFHPEDAYDGVCFEDAVGRAIYGLGSCQQGTDTLEVWIKQASASARENLVWRAIAMNQTKAMQALDTALGRAKDVALLTPASWSGASASLSWDALSEVYRAAADLADIVAGNATGTGASVDFATRPSVDRLLGGDRIMATLGDSIFKPFLAVADGVGEKIVQTALLIRAGASTGTATALVAAQATYERVDRARWVQRVRSGAAIAEGLASRERVEIQRRWSALKTQVDSEGASQMRGVRIGVLVAVLEGINLWKMSQLTQDDPKVALQLRAAQMATLAAGTEVAAALIQATSHAQDAARSFLVLKMAGGALSAGAGYTLGQLDWADSKEMRSVGRYRTANLLLIRSGANFINAAFGVAISLAYADPFLKALQRRYVFGTTMRLASAVTGRLFALRIFLVTGTGVIGVGILLISISIWIFSDNELEIWCERCAFGKAQAAKRYISAETQMDDLAKALLEAL